MHYSWWINKEILYWVNNNFSNLNILVFFFKICKKHMYQLNTAEENRYRISSFLTHLLKKSQITQLKPQGNADLYL